MPDDKNINNELFNPEEMQSPFDSIKEVSIRLAPTTEGLEKD